MFKGPARNDIFCGTPNWTAPELLRSEISGNSAQPTEASDIYSLSMVLWEILSGRIPFGKLSYNVYF